MGKICLPTKLSVEGQLSSWPPSSAALEWVGGCDSCSEVAEWRVAVSRVRKSSASSGSGFRI